MKVRDGLDGRRMIQPFQRCIRRDGWLMMIRWMEP